MSRLLAVLALALAAAASCARAGEAPPAASDPVLEARMMDVAEKLRCLVCQNQTIADSQASLAVDLRQEIREQLAKGATENDIIDYMTARYGDFVLYKPPFKASTALLWLGPLLLLLGGLLWLFRVLRGRRSAVEPQLTEADRRRARELLEGNSK